MTFDTCSSEIPPKPTCNAPDCNHEADIYWAPIHVNSDGLLQPVRKGEYGLLLLCPEHWATFFAACQEWFDSMNRIERAAAALLGELCAGPDSLANPLCSFDKERLRLAARRVLGAAEDPLWGRR